MGKIVLLDELTINKIAAGEVIERPASVIKEMLENSIDAGANNVVIEIKNGGISYIRISDNGKGIARDDVELAFERHATSKIRSADDLQDVKSMGFRGEALASIAAIANVELVSKTEEEQVGTKITVEGGNILNIEEMACSRGTTITVKNLFYNTPVRYKFLKKDFTETGYIEDVVTRIALIHPEIAIKLINAGRPIISTNGNGDMKSVVYSIYGKDVANEIIPVDYEYDYIKIKGVIGKPAIARSNRANQIFFVNERYIKDKILSAAAEQAYKGMIPIGKFAFLILNLEMDPSKVDVNVHPAKLEVRFSDENVAFQSVYHAIKNILLETDLISNREKDKEDTASTDTQKLDFSNNGEGGLFSKKTLSKVDNTKKIGNSTLKRSEEEINVFERLKRLQQDLQKQIDSNPGIKLTDDYKKMTEKYNEIVTNTEKISSFEEKIEPKEEAAVNNETENKEEVAVYNETGYKEEKIINNELDNKENIINNELDNKENIINNEPKLEEMVQELNKNEILVQNNETRLPDTTSQDKALQEIKELLDKKDDDDDVEEEKIEEKIQTKEEQIQKAEEDIDTFEEMYKKLFGKEPYGGRIQVEEKKEEDPYKIKDSDFSDNISVFESMSGYNKPAYKFIGIAFKTYIILEMNNELYIMDQHAAHERILYEKVKANFYSETDKDAQMLLLPDIITLTNKEMNIAKDNFRLFEEAGFMVEEFGENTVKVSGVPDVCIDLDTKELFLETLDEINTVARTAKQEKEERFIATIACKAAVKANMALTEDEVNSLMDELLKLPNPFSCPHGRPTVIKMSKYDIERKFERK